MLRATTPPWRAFFLALLCTPFAGAQLRQAPARPQAPPGQPIPSIEKYRDGHALPLVTSAEWIRLPTDEVDFNAQTLLLVDGKPITQTDLRRSLCLLLGTSEIDQFITYALVTELCERWSRSVDVDESEVLKQFEAQKEMLAQTGQRDPDEWEKQIRESFGWERYVEFQKIQLGFEKLFLPDPPPGFLEAQARKFEEVLPAWQLKQAEWKQAFEAARRAAQEEGKDPDGVDLPAPEQPVPEADLSFLNSDALALIPEDYRSMVTEGYARGQELHPYLRMGMVADVKRQLLAKANVEFEPSRLEAVGPDVLFTVDGKPVKIDEIYTMIESRIEDSNRRLALRELVHLAAADIALEREDALIGLELADSKFEELRAKYANTFIPLPNVIFLRGFPNEYHYKRYWRRKVSYQLMLEKTLPEERLREHFEGSGKLFFDRGSVTGNLLFFPYSEGVEVAQQKMSAALERLTQGEQLQDVARAAGTYPATPGVENGRFTGMVRNRLRQVLHESEYSAFAMGYSLADEVFYLGSEGELVGPVETDFTDQLRGLLVVGPERFESGGNRQDFETARENALEDLADLTFARFVNDALATLKIELASGRP